MLHHQHGHAQVGGQAWQHTGQSIRASRGHTDQDQRRVSGFGNPPHSLADIRRRTYRGRGGQAHRPDSLAAGSAVVSHRAAQQGANLPAPAVRGQERGQRPAQFLHLRLRAAVQGFGHEIKRPQFQGPNGLIAALLREGADHDHGHFQAAVLNGFEHRQAVHAGHLDVQGHHVGTQRSDPVEGDRPGVGRADDLDARDTGEHVAEDPAVRDGIIHDQGRNAIVPLLFLRQHGVQIQQRYQPLAILMDSDEVPAAGLVDIGRRGGHGLLFRVDDIRDLVHE